MGNAARKLDPPPPAAVERRAWLLSLPLSETPATEDEIALFEQAEEDMVAGRRGTTTTEDMFALIEQMRRDSGE